MKVIGAMALPVKSSKDIVKVRRQIVSTAKSVDMNLMRETELRTAATELLVNMLRYGGGGVVTVEQVEHDGQRGVRASFEDKGPGIQDLDAALSKGFSTSKSLGHGLPGCRNLVDLFEIATEAGKGTTVTITKWN